MIPRRRIRRPAVALFVGAAVAVPLLTACGAGQIAVTTSEHSVIDGANGAVHGVLVRYAYIDNETGYDVIPAGGDTRAYLRIFNDNAQDDNFLGASSPAAQSVDIVAEGSGATPSVAASATPSVGGSSGGAAIATLPIPAAAELALVPGRYRLQISGLHETLRSGQSIPVTFRFADAGELTLQVPVQTPSMPPPVGSVSPTRSAYPANVEPAAPGRRVSSPAP